MSQLEVRHLTKLYNSIPAVEGISFELQPYQVLGYLGPNGSGKTTTVNILAGLLQPTRGAVLFDGRDIRECLVEYKQRLGYVPEVPYIYPFLTGEEYLQLVGRLRGMAESLLNRKIADLLNRLWLWDHRHSAIASYSKGMKQKVLIAAALLHNPDVLIFDEPLSGLDVTSALVFKNLLKQLAAAGKAILYSSHQLDVVEKVCSRVVILRSGRIVAHDSVDHLRNLMAVPSLEDVFAELVVQEDTEQIAAEIVQVIGA